MRPATSIEVLVLATYFKESSHHGL